MQGGQMSQINENTALQLRDNAQQMLMSIKSIEGGVEYLNKVRAIEVWAKAEKKDAELQNMIAEQKIRTQRILGRLIQEGQKRGELASQKTGRGDSVKCNQEEHIKTLSDIGLTSLHSFRHKYHSLFDRCALRSVAKLTEDLKVPVRI